MEDMNAPRTLGYSHTRQDSGSNGQFNGYSNGNDSTLTLSTDDDSTPDYSNASYSYAKNPTAGYSNTSYSNASFSNANYSNADYSSGNYSNANYSPDYQTSNDPTSNYSTWNQSAESVPRSSDSQSVYSSVASTTRSTGYTASHRRDSVSSTGTATTFLTTPSVNDPVPLHIQAEMYTHNLPMSRIRAPYQLMCECDWAHCYEIFQADEVEAWISHSFSHFGLAGPPPESKCTICNIAFDRDHWQERMEHINQHFVDESTATYKPTLRPDFSLVKYFARIGAISSDEFDNAMRQYPPPRGSAKLLPLGSVYETEEMKLRAERDSRVPDDLDQERRQIRNEAKKGKSKSTKDTKDEKHHKRHHKR